MSEIQIIIVAVSAFVFILICALASIVLIRLRRVVKTRFAELNDLLSALQADQERETLRKPGSK